MKQTRQAPEEFMPAPVEYPPAAHLTHADARLAAADIEYAPGAHGVQADAALAPVVVA